MKAELNKKSIDKYLHSVDDALEANIKMLAGVTELADDADYEACCSTLFEITAYKTEIAEEKNKVIGAAKLIIETVGGWFGPREKKVTDHIDRLKGLVRAYNIEKEEERQRTLKAASAMAKIDPKQARELNSRAEAVLPPKVKGIAFVGKVEVTVTDESKLPDIYFKRVVDEAKLKAAVESGELDEKSAGKMGVLLIDNRTVRVTPSQRDKA